MASVPGQRLSQAKREGLFTYNIYNSQAAQFTDATR